MAAELRIGFWLLLLGGLLWLLAPVLTPFLFSAILAYLGDPLADRLEIWGLSRTAAVVSVFVTLIGSLLLLLLVIVPSLERQLVNLLQQGPAVLDWLKHSGLPWLRDHLPIDTALVDIDALKGELTQALGQAGGIVQTLLATAARSSSVVIGFLVNLFLVPVLTFYLLRDWDVLVARIRALLPRRIEPPVSALAAETNEVLGAFLRGQFAVMLALGAIYAVGLTLLGLHYGLLIGLLAGLVSFVPYMGFIVGIGVAGVAALVQYQDLLHVALVAGVFAIGQALEGTVLTPRLVGERIGLHPVAVIFAVLAGGHLFGFFGVLLALPVASIVMVLLRHTHDRYLASDLYEG